MQELHKVLIKLFKTHLKTTNAEFRKVGLTRGQPKVLDFVVINNGCIQKDIAENCSIQAATVTSLLANMEKIGLIYRKKNDENRRILNVFITEKGIEAQKQVKKIFDDSGKICFKHFSEQEKIEAVKLLTKIQKNLDGKEKDNA